eukprot:g4411.t1
MDILTDLFGEQFLHHVGTQLQRGLVCKRGLGFGVLAAVCTAAWKTAGAAFASAPTAASFAGAHAAPAAVAHVSGLAAAAPLATAAGAPTAVATAAAGGGAAAALGGAAAATSVAAAGVLAAATSVAAAGFNAVETREARTVEKEKQARQQYEHFVLQQVAMGNYDVETNPAVAAEKLFGDLILNVAEQKSKGKMMTREDGDEDDDAGGQDSGEQLREWSTRFVREVVLPVKRVLAPPRGADSTAPPGGGGEAAYSSASLALTGLKMDVFTMLTQQQLHLLQKFGGDAVKQANSHAVLALAYVLAAMTTDKAELWFRGSQLLDNVVVGHHAADPAEKEHKTAWGCLYEFAKAKAAQASGERSGFESSGESLDEEATKAYGKSTNGSWELAKKTSLTVFLFENMLPRVAGANVEKEKEEVNKGKGPTPSTSEGVSPSSLQSLPEQKTTDNWKNTRKQVHQFVMLQRLA